MTARQPVEFYTVKKGDTLWKIAETHFRQRQGYALHQDRGGQFAAGEEPRSYSAGLGSAHPEALSGRSTATQPQRLPERRKGAVANHMSPTA